MLAKYNLVLQTEPEVGKSYELQLGVNTLGRDRENLIMINHPEVSRRHCELSYENGTFYVQDAGSLNGTYLDGEKLVGKQPLYPGVLLGLGGGVSAVLQASTNVSMAEPANAPVTPMEQTLVEPIEEVIAEAYSIDDGELEEETEGGTGLFGGGTSRMLLIALAVLLVCLIIGIILFLWFIDTYSLWCHVLPFLFEPGVCP